MTTDRVYWCVSCKDNMQLKILSLVDGTLLNDVVYQGDFNQRDPILNEPLVLENDCALVVDHAGNLVAFDCANVAVTPTIAFRIELGSGI